jgi:hypothetical protein
LLDKPKRHIRRLSTISTTPSLVPNTQLHFVKVTYCIVNKQAAAAYERLLP